LDIEKHKKEREELVKARQLQDQRLASMEHSILDLNGMVERCQREIDKNNTKRE
jgi:hypothetical protein